MCQHTTKNILAKFLRYWLLLGIIPLNFSSAQNVEVLNPFFHFPGGSDPYQGIILAIDLPLDNGGFPDVHFSLLYEAAYLLPTNETRFEYPPLIASRKFVYEMLEQKFKSYGYDGKNCLLRTICEAAKHTSQYTGVLGDLVHVILIPSSSRKEDFLDVDYEQSEEYGTGKGHCTKYENNCPLDLLNKISRILVM